jgi:putative ABC transport system substrate-binding protein
MKRREFITLLGGAAAAWPRNVTAQNVTKVYRVGTLIIGAPVGDKSLYGAALIRGLAQYGYELDRNLVVEHLGAEMQLDRLPRLVDELVASKG